MGRPERGTLAPPLGHSGGAKVDGAPEPGRWGWIGGAPCLDFINTLDWRGDPARQVETLPDVAALSAWCQAAGLATPAPGTAAQAASSRAAVALLGRALALREALHGLVCAAIDGAPPSANALALLNRHLRNPLLLTPRGGALRCTVVRASKAGPELAGLEAALALLAQDAARLLAGPQVGHLRRCASPDCGWVFLEGHRPRHWCSMASCGNRAKVRRHYRRTRDSEAEAKGRPPRRPAGGARGGGEARR